MFDRLQSIFQNITERLFTDQSLYEQTKLHFFLMEQPSGAEAVYFDKKLLLTNESKGCRIMIGNRSLIRKYLKNKFRGHEYILETVRIDGDEKIICSAFLILVFPCLSNDYDCLVLKCLAQQLAVTAGQMLEELPPESQEKDLVREMIENMEVWITFRLQKMFKPLDIDLVTSLSGEYYENAECASNMVFLPYPFANNLRPNDLCYHFEDIAFIPQNSRLLRKLLQMAQQNLYLTLGESETHDSFKALGICTKASLNKFLKRNTDIALPCIRVEIKKHMYWKMFLNEKYIFTHKNGHYKIDSSLKIKKKYLKGKITEYFGEQPDRYENLIESIIQSEEQKHGTMLVIMGAEDARNEAQRLGRLRYGFREKEPGIQKEINCLNAIDGSVLIDTDGKVHGIGMILDGISSPMGNPARGARYNSVVKYWDWLRKPDSGGLIKAMIIIISEDGPINIMSI